MHDEASFTANLLLASGEENTEFVKTELCVDGEANYDVNIAKVRISQHILNLSKPVNMTR